MLLNFLLCCAKRFASCEVALEFGEKYIPSEKNEWKVFSPTLFFLRRLAIELAESEVFLISTCECWKLPLEAIQTLASIPAISLFLLGPSRPDVRLIAFALPSVWIFPFQLPWPEFRPASINFSRSRVEIASINTFLSSRRRGNLIFNQLPFIWSWAKGGGLKFHRNSFCLKSAFVRWSEKPCTRDGTVA